ncbi:hypothetical protein GM676_04585 [Duganella radicis]|uniref:BrnT family toxin n=1 Tax=Duganella radicis TaxID=551988 RepID=A0A6L6PD65_9BURK|nr:BrnT family toxin [Duganella radicis]MTV36863.1 hypothetical protein [Duganella radicis]
MTIYTWDETKRKSNVRKHGLDFADAPGVIENRAFTTEDVRFHYTSADLPRLDTSRTKQFL